MAASNENRPTPLTGTRLKACSARRKKEASVAASLFLVFVLYRITSVTRLP